MMKKMINYDDDDDDYQYFKPNRRNKMAKLDAKKRNKIPTKEFGLPGERKYPMPDKAHAANAKSRASQMVKVGKISPAQKAKIDAKADAKLYGGKKAPKAPAKKPTRRPTRRGY